LVKVGAPTQKDFKKGQNRVTGLNRAANKMESAELEEMYASTTEPHKDGHRSKVVRTQPNGKTTMSYLGQHVYKSKEHARNAADHIANGMRKGRASDSYIQDFARRHHKEHGMKESTQIDEAKLDELSPATHKSYQAKAFTSGAKGMAAKRMGTMSAKDAYDNEVKRHKGIDTSKYLNRKHHGIKDSVEEAKDMYKSAATELKNYAKKSGGIDAPTFHAAAKHIENIGRSNVMQKGQHLGILSKHLRDMDTSPREKVLSVLHKHGHDVSNFGGYKMRRESVEEAGSPERYKMIKKAGDKYNKEKKKAERDAKRAMSKDKDMMGENNSAPQSAAHRRAQMGSRYSDIMKKRQADNEKARQALKDPSHNPAWANSKSKTEETVSELKKSTLGSYVNKASKDAASKAYSAASAAKDNNTEKGGKDFSKSMKRLRGINTATKKLAKEDTNEAKSFDQKFKDHLKFATSKSPAVQDYLAKRKANRDAMNKKNDPNAAKKGYALTAVPPERKYQKLQKAKKAGKA
jgi:hypothetical protein